MEAATTAAARARLARRTARRMAGDDAEESVACHLVAMGWTILARNVRVGRSEIDIVARDGAGTLVFVEVRSRSTPGFGAPEESVDRAKVGRLYTAASTLVAVGRLPGGPHLPDPTWRIDLITTVRDEAAASWHIGLHLRGLAPP